MKILFVSAYNPFQSGSGPGNGLNNLSQALAAIGCDVHILTPKIEKTGDLGKGVTLHYYDNPLKNTVFAKSWIPFSLFSIRQIKYLCNKYGIDIVNGRSPSTFFYSAIRDKKLPFVVSAHGTSFGEISSVYKTPFSFLNLQELIGAGIIQPMWASLTNIEYKCSSRVVAVSRAVAHELISYYHIDRKKIVVIPNGVKSSNVIDEKEEDNLILSVGRMIWRKGFTYLIKAMPLILEDFPKTRLLLVGSGQYRDKLTAYIKSLNLQGVVTIHETVPKEKLFYLYSKAQIYAQPSLYEPLCNTLLEAMSQQKPVVASNVGGIPEIITNQKNGLLVDPYNASQLADAIKLFLSDSNYRKKLGHNAKLTVDENFSWSLVAKKTSAMYKELVT